MPVPRRTVPRNGNRRITKFVGLQLAISAIAFSATCFAGGKDTAIVSQQSVRAKTKYCQDCHGLSGQGLHASLPIPRIAGQTPKYIENQLSAFAESTRDKDVSVNIPKVHAVSPTMRTALAAHFSELTPPPLGDGPEPLVAAGKKIYEEGVPEANVPACSGCHGPEAKGREVIPRLAGQIYSYTVKELTHWNKERGHGPAETGISSVMTPVAHTLTEPQIDAVAAYLSYLK